MVHPMRSGGSSMSSFAMTYTAVLYSCSCCSRMKTGRSAMTVGAEVEEVMARKSVVKKRYVMRMWMPSEPLSRTPRTHPVATMNAITERTAMRGAMKALLRVHAIHRYLTRVMRFLRCDLASYSCLASWSVTEPLCAFSACLPSEPLRSTPLRPSSRRSSTALLSADLAQIAAKSAPSALTASMMRSGRVMPDGEGAPAASRKPAASFTRPWKHSWPSWRRIRLSKQSKMSAAG
mmetsp:Transcript_7734/g.25664  ORF Transcript_7734/g.25664 Transcript_7734/m.25664 type:complete len:234 (-) Transcript_7734:714-1415(-)